VTLKAEEITVAYRPGLLSRSARPVLEGLSITLEKGETVGLMGASGSGKSTLGRVLAGLERPQAGAVTYRGNEIRELGREEYAVFRQHVQVMFQDPTGALNPKKTIEHSFEDVLRLLRVPPARRGETVRDALSPVGLDEEVLPRLPSQLSGGQNQRIALARILLLDPEYIVLDEPTSALDVSVQAQVLHLLKDLQEERGLGYLFISHDPDVVGFMADRRGVLRGGKFCEEE